MGFQRSAYLSLVDRRQEKSLMKLIVDEQTDKVIGASMCGPDAAEIMQASFLP